MDAKIFDPFDEDELSDWMATPPAKEILSAYVFDTALQSAPRQVALVFYSEEHIVSGSAHVEPTHPSAAPHPLPRPSDQFGAAVESVTLASPV
jgi:hypothetical protein